MQSLFFLFIIYFLIQEFCNQVDVHHHLPVDVYLELVLRLRPSVTNHLVLATGPETVLGFRLDEFPEVLEGCRRRP